MFYRFVPPDPSRNPTHRPRGEPQVVPQRTSPAEAVAYTGRPVKDSGSIPRKRRAELQAKGKIRR
jgi:hypothetical protein